MSRPIRPGENLIIDCPTSPSGSHVFLHETSEHAAFLTCMYCKAQADPLPPDPLERWSKHE